MESLQRKVATLTVLKKEEAHTVQQENIRAAGMLCELVKSCIGPKAMVKMVLTRIGTVELTNDGNSILREMEVTHPVIKSLVELSRTQSEEAGDGTTSVVILASEILQNMAHLLKEGMHPVVMCSALKKALEYMLERMKKHQVDLSTVRKEKGTTEEQVVKDIIRQSVGTKMSKHLLGLEALAYTAVCTIKAKDGGKVHYDIKNNVKVEKIPGGRIEESAVLDGVIVQKGVLDPATKKRVENAKVLLIDFPLEYRKSENQMHIEMHTQEVYGRTLEIEEEQVEKMAKCLIEAGPSVIVSEKGISDHAISLFKRSGIAAIRRVKKSENQRIALATGAQIVSRAEDAGPKVLGTAGVFDTVHIGEEEYSRFIKCADPKACSVVLRGPSKDILNELERNLHDALHVARNVQMSSGLVHGGGAIEMALAQELEQAQHLAPHEKKVFFGVSQALQSIAGILISNSGNTHPFQKLMELKALHAQGKHTQGVDGNTGEIGLSSVLESVFVKEQSLKLAIEGSIIILRVDGVVKQG
ncbi:T-complex protein 1 subunit gamma [Nematocida sp. AWRm77]|nr:T-complex protein 1 subunit gamma [Nematocida sp. AWRm77]